ncbi:hypothetical protein LINPERPRIM_LOCUS11385 [Linum perenne]
MGDNKRSLAMARMELEDLYSGIPDDSVNLTFQDMAKVDDDQPMVKPTTSSIDRKYQNRRPTTPTAIIEPIRIPSIDFNRGLEAKSKNPQGQPHPTSSRMEEYRRDSSHVPNRSPRGSSQQHHNVVMMDAVSYERSSVMASPYSTNDMSRSSVATNGNSMYDVVGKGGTLTWFVQVCGRVYCRNCVNMGMGNMTEGRKCIECVGRRFSARYIKKAGTVGCCSGYSSAVKHAEIKWAEKGPRRSGERAYGGQQGSHRGLKSGSSTPMASPLTPSRNPPSYLMGSPYSPYSSSHHHLPL